MTGIDDIILIQRNVSLFLNSIDRIDLDTIAQCCADDMIFDYSSFFGETAREVSAALFLADLAQLLPGFDGTKHLVTNFVVDLDSESTALSECAIQGIHMIGSDIWTVLATYHHRHVRMPKGWRLTYMRPELGFMIGAPLIETARRRVANGISREFKWSGSTVATGPAPMAS